MVDLVKHTEELLDFVGAKRLVVACSGGLDSTVLLHICKKLRYHVEIAHVNYQLRGEESEADQQFLESLAKELHVPIHVKRIDLKEELKKGGNLQQVARNHRNAFFSKIRRDKRAAYPSYILLGHHKEDQTETFFMNLARNSGVLGLAGMERVTIYNKLRPFLSISKDELRAYALENKIKWREDSSNESLKYTRNKWRNVVLPELRKEIPTLDDAVQILTQQFQQKHWEIHDKIEALMEDIQCFNSLPVATFHALDEFEQKALCDELEIPIGMLETWRNLSHKGTGFSWKPSVFSRSGSRLVLDGDTYSFLTLEEEIQPISFKKEIVVALPENFDKQAIYLDSDLISGELRFRPVTTGDRIYPIGMKGSRLVSDVISDAKMNGLEKQKLQILVDDESVLWVPKLCISRKAIASQDSSEIIKITLD